VRLGHCDLLGPADYQLAVADHLDHPPGACQKTRLGQLVDLHYTHVGRYERGASKPSAEALRRLADALGVSTDYLTEGTTEEAAKARFEDRELLRQSQEVESLPDDDRIVVKKLLDAFLTKKQIQRLAG